MVCKYGMYNGKGSSRWYYFVVCVCVCVDSPRCLESDLVALSLCVSEYGAGAYNTVEWELPEYLCGSDLVVEVSTEVLSEDWRLKF